MATESVAAARRIAISSGVTTAAAFEKAPAFPGGMFQVNAGVESYHALAAAQIVGDFVRGSLREAVQTPLEADQAWILALLLEMSDALYRAAGAEV